MITKENIQNMEAVKKFKEEFEFLEYYLFDYPRPYKNRKRTLTITIKELKKWYNRTIESIIKNIE